REECVAVGVIAGLADAHSDLPTPTTCQRSRGAVRQVAKLGRRLKYALARRLGNPRVRPVVEDERDHRPRNSRPLRDISAGRRTATLLPGLIGRWRIGILAAGVLIDHSWRSSFP